MTLKFRSTRHLDLARKKSLRLSNHRSIKMLNTGALTKVAPKVALGVRQMSVVSGPPTVKISTPELIAHGVAITIGVTAIPAYILVNLKNYRNKT